MHPITVYSFGYLHPMPEDLPPFDITVDLRRLLADPAHRPEGDMLDMTGLDATVEDFVLKTPGALDLRWGIYRMARDLHEFKPVHLGIGCAGGRHRSVATAEAVRALLTSASVQDVTVQHLHVHLPRVIRQETDANR